MTRGGIRVLVAAFAVIVSTACGAQMLKKEPGAGQLAAGAVVLVDDGTCGPGKVKQVTGGSNMSMSGGQMLTTGSARKRKCVIK
jgi:hypothetical protein